jgi:DNA-binding NarL/FixJ family response regulator
MSEISVLLIEDHDLTRMGLKIELHSRSGFKVVGEADSAYLGLKLLETTNPDVAVIDIGLPGMMDGIELTRKFRRYQEETGQSQTKILILTMNYAENVVLAAFAAGADSYYMKGTDVNKFIEAVQATFNGNSWIDPAIASIVLRKMRPSALEIEYEQVLETYPLTQRELEILGLIVAGCSNSQIAEKLYITVGTVKTHVRNILNKLCADDRTQAAVRALRSGFRNSYSETHVRNILNKLCADDRTQEAGSGVLETLTQREREILDLIVAGWSNSQIAEKLYITVDTVKTHVCNILDKFKS